MPGKSAPFLTKAEYHSSQSPQCTGPAAENVPEKGKQRPWPLQAADPSASETFPFFMMASTESVLQSHSLPLRVKPFVPFPYKNNNDSSNTSGEASALSPWKNIIFINHFQLLQ